jgi:hypothetical protein
MRRVASLEYTCKVLTEQVRRLQVKLCGNDHQWIETEVVENFGDSPLEYRQIHHYRCSVCEKKKVE